MRVLGVDPGATTGLALLEWSDGELLDTCELAQCNYRATVTLVMAMLSDPYIGPDVVAVEAFVVRHRAASSTSQGRKGGKLARALLAEIGAETLKRGLRYRERPAAMVKAWATDQRLYAAGLHRQTAGMPHARDAARHALFAGVRELGHQTDPMLTNQPLTKER